MEEEKPNTSQEVFSEVQMKAITAMVRGLLEELLIQRPSKCSLQLENVVGPQDLQTSEK